MAIKVYNNSPYYDDFDVQAQTSQDGGQGLSPSEKNYLRILFRPGHSVQARELTQMQTALQAQIDRFGRHIFTDGSRVLGGLATFDTEYAYVKVESTFDYPTGTSLNADNYFNDANGAILTGLTSGVVADVVAVTAADSNDPLTLFVKYKTSGTNKTDTVFNAEEILQTNTTPTRHFKVKPVLDTPTGYGCNFSIDEGVYFIKGNFVYNASQQLIIDKYNNTPSARVVYVVSENVITSAEDSTLLDNALGAPNETAPGAHRYQIDLTLTKQPYDLAQRDGDNIVQLGRLRNGIVEEVVTESTYAEILKTMANRTHEESGNYTVKPFEITFKDHPTDSTKLQVQVDPSVAYVNGYRIANKAPKYIDLDKARDTARFNGASIGANVGNYVIVDDLTGVPDLETFGTINLQNSSGSNIGTARVRSIEYVSGTIGQAPHLGGTATAQYKVYLFDIQMTPPNQRSAIARLSDTGLTPAFRADLVTTGEILDAGNNSALFKLPFNVIKSLRAGDGSVDFFYETRYVQSIDVADAKLTIAPGTGDFAFVSTSAKDFVIVVESLPGAYGGSLQVGDMIDVTGAIAAASDSTPTNPKLEITSFTSADNGVRCRVQVHVRKNVQEKTKTFEDAGQIQIATPTGNDSLQKADIYRIVSVIEDSTQANITDRYELDNGQRENFYEVGRVKLISGAQAPTGSITVNFEYFSHSSGDYFAVNSYSDYDQILNFDSSKLGKVSLSDVVDFRPRKDDTNGEFQGSSLGLFVAPGSIITSDIEYYLPRVDKVYVDYRARFGIVKGTSAAAPMLPSDPDNAMVLYKLRVPPYTFRAGDVKARMVENRRYTMRDIGKLENRINNLEYYTSLSLLEKSAKDTQLFDGTGNERFKNGFIVDGFYGHNVGDVGSADYRIAMDKENGILRPHFHQDSTRLVYKSGAQKTGNLVTLPYTEVMYDEQPYASRTENLNPYFIFKWKGMMDISPTSDEWKDVEERPEVVVDLGTGIYDAIEFLANEIDVVGTEWNSWQTNWTGREILSQETFDFNDGNSFGESQRTTTLVTQEQSRDGIRTDLFPGSMTADLGTRVINVDFAPFIRSRKIYFRAQRMKPNTRVYMFFDGQNISDYVRVTGESYTNYVDTEEVTRYRGLTAHPDGAEAANLITDQNGVIEGSFIIPLNDTLKFKTGTRVVRLTDSSTNNLTDETTSADANYEARGLLQTTEGTAISTTIPRFEVSEVGENRTVTEQVVTTDVLWRQNIPQDDGDDDNGDTGGTDPLAQSFTISERDGIFATSVDVYFKTKDETDNTPVILQLRTVENGVPSKTVLPYSEVVKFPADISVSADASVATRFTFESPVYLRDSAEYSIVLIALNTKYTAYVSELGEFDVTNSNLRITDQPHLGSFFMSQNASTWTPEQFKDLKFKLNRANFSSSSTAYLQNAQIPDRQLKNNPFFTYNGSNLIRVVHRNHGMFEGSKVTLTMPDGAVGTTTLNNIPYSDIDGLHTIQDVEMDSYVIQVATNANDTGRLGGTGWFASENNVANVIQPHIEQIVLPPTTINYDAKMVSGKSLAAQNETPYRFTDWFEVIPGTNTYLTKLHAISSPENMTLQDNVNERSFQLRAAMSTINSTVSPVIDLERASVIMVNNRIDNPIGGNTASSGFNNIKDDPLSNSRYVAETVAEGNTGLSRYITRQVTLADPADDLKIYILTSKPGVADVDLYYKVQLTGDDGRFSDIGWTLIAPDDTIVPSENPEVYDEVEYTLDDVGPFSSFALKIVLRSENSSSVPLIKDLRAIALSN